MQRAARATRACRKRTFRPVVKMCGCNLGHAWLIGGARRSNSGSLANCPTLPTAMANSRRSSASRPSPWYGRWSRNKSRISSSTKRDGSGVYSVARSIRGQSDHRCNEHSAFRSSNDVRTPSSSWVTSSLFRFFWVARKSKNSTTADHLAIHLNVINRNRNFSGRGASASANLENFKRCAAQRNL